MAGIYIHIPFCRQACSYCDFHFSTNLQNKQALVAAICRELALRKDYLPGKTIESVYFGGGTPSLLTVSELESIMNAVSRYFHISQAAEVTLEVNPDDIDQPKLKAWKKAGINRLSVGLQSFNDEELTWMNRAHSSAQAVDSVKLAQDSGFGNITIDLIYGSKFQTLSSWEKTLQQAIALNTQHISSYNLTIENKTALGVQFKKGKEPAVNEDLSSTQFLLMKHLLEQAGFIHYEVSNFGRRGFFAKHNSNYWLQQPYLGLGPSAHSFDGLSRQWNVKNNARYIEAITSSGEFFEKEMLNTRDRYNEYILTRLRTIWGCNKKEMQALFGDELADHFAKGIREKKDLVVEKNGVYTLSAAGLLQADGIASDLFVV